MSESIESIRRLGHDAVYGMFRAQVECRGGEFWGQPDETPEQAARSGACEVLLVYPDSMALARAPDDRLWALRQWKTGVYACCIYTPDE